MSKFNNFKLRVSAATLATMIGLSACAKESKTEKKENNNTFSNEQWFTLPKNLEGNNNTNIISEDEEKIITFNEASSNIETEKKDEEVYVEPPVEIKETDQNAEIIETVNETSNDNTQEIVPVEPKSSFDEYAKVYGLDDTEIDAISKTMNNKIEIIKSDSDKSLIAANYVITLNKAIDKLCNAYDPAKEIFNPSKANLTGNEDTKIISDYIDVIENFSKNPTSDNLSNVMLLFRRFIFLDASEKNLDPGQVNFTIVYSSNMIYTIVEKNKLRLSTDDKNDINHHKTLGFIYGYSDGQIDCDKNKQLIK